MPAEINKRTMNFLTQRAVDLRCRSGLWSIGRR
jgi:hypothetical protein